MSPTAIDPRFAQDADLAHRVASGDEQAFRVFFDEYYDRVYRFAMARLDQDHHLAEDIVQSSFTKALDGLQHYRGEAKLITWICTICRNLIVDWQRKHGAATARVLLIEDTPEMQLLLDTLKAPESSEPHSLKQREEAFRLIQVVLDRLPAQYGDILEWKFIEGYTAKEIANKLNLSVAATNSLTARAKKAFGELYLPLVNAYFGSESLVGEAK